MLFLVQFFVWGGTFAQMLIAGLPDSETAGALATFMFSLTLVFNGVMQPPDALPGFWIFMYRVSPLTYVVDGIAAAGLSGRAVVCADNELSIFDPPGGSTCGEYMQPYIQAAGPGAGTLSNPDATSNCTYCALATADQFLASYSIDYADRWRNFGIVNVYIVFNITVAVILYYLIRARTGNKKEKGEKKKTKEQQHQQDEGAAV